MDNKFLDDKKKICMFCKKKIDCKNEKYYHIEYYDCGNLMLKQWSHVSCREKVAEMKAMQRIENKMKEMMPRAINQFSKMMEDIEK
jgi:hypothetical protein